LSNLEQKGHYSFKLIISNIFLKFINKLNMLREESKLLNIENRWGNIRPWLLRFPAFYSWFGRMKHGKP